MAEILLSAHDLVSIDRILTATDDGGRDVLLPDGVLRILTELFPSSVAEVSELDPLSGVVLRSERFPPRANGPFTHCLHAALPATNPGRDVSVVVRRRDQPFTARDRVIFRLLTPTLQEMVVTLRRRREVRDLSPCEERVLSLVAQGASNADVSHSLFVSVATVRKHLEHIYLKLGVSSRTAAVAKAFPNGVAKEPGATRAG